jgi:hypothetical protein
VQRKYPDQRDTAFKLGQIAIDALRAALAQQARPVAWMVYTEDGESVYVTDNPAYIKPSQRALPLFTTAQQAKPGDNK